MGNSVFKYPKFQYHSNMASQGASLNDISKLLDNQVITQCCLGNANFWTTLYKQCDWDANILEHNY